MRCLRYQLHIWRPWWLLRGPPTTSSPFFSFFPSSLCLSLFSFSLIPFSSVLICTTGRPAQISVLVPPFLLQMLAVIWFVGGRFLEINLMQGFKVPFRILVSKVIKSASLGQIYLIMFSFQKAYRGCSLGKRLLNCCSYHPNT